MIEYLKRFGVNPDTTATIFLTLFIFIAGLFTTWLANKLKRWKEKKSYRKSIKAILVEFKIACDRQDKIVRASIAKSGLTTGNNYIVGFVPIGTLDYLTRLDLTTFLQNFEPTFSNKKFPKAISKLFDVLAVIKSQNESLKDDMKFFGDKFEASEDLYNENLEALRKIHDEFGNNFDGKELNINEGGRFVQDYFNVFGDWFQKGRKTTMISTHTEIVTPILEFREKHKNIPYLLPIINHALKCDYAFQNIKKIELFSNQRYDKFALAHRRASKLISVIVNII